MHDPLQTQNHAVNATRLSTETITVAKGPSSLLRNTIENNKYDQQ
jgi:hypothetical protein